MVVGLNGMTDSNCNLVESMSGGSLMGKSIPESWTLFERLAENSQQWISILRVEDHHN